MADEWIKMRGSLLEHPKVIAAARLLLEDPLFLAWAGYNVTDSSRDRHVTARDASRYIVTGGLLKLWSVARAHGKWRGVDLVLEHSKLADVDEMAGVPGLAKAMIGVGWLANGPEILLPNFNEFNTVKTDAVRAKAYRDRQRAELREVRSRTVTEPSRDRHGPSRSRGRGREEKSTPSQGSSTLGHVQTTTLPNGEGSEAPTSPSTITHEGEDPPVPIAAWEGYREAYLGRYAVEPVRNAKANALMQQLARRLGKEAPAVAAFYLTHNSGLYVSSRHALELLVRDAEGLRTQWATGVKSTHLEGRSAEQRDAVLEQVKRVSERMGGKP